MDLLNRYFSMNGRDESRLLEVRSTVFYANARCRVLLLSEAQVSVT